jgi:hypothetical protein
VGFIRTRQGVKVAQAVWGQPKKTRHMSKSTARAVLNEMGQTKNLPLYWDEFKDRDAQAQVYSTFIDTTQGLEGGRLDTNAHQKDRGDWQTLMLVCSNHSFVDFIVEKQATTDAGLLRCFEYEIKKKPRGAKGMIDDTNAGLVLQDLETNFGLMGKRYAELLERTRRECTISPCDPFTRSRQSSVLSMKSDSGQPFAVVSWPVRRMLINSAATFTFPRLSNSCWPGIRRTESDGATRPLSVARWQTCKVTCQRSCDAWPVPHHLSGLLVTRWRRLERLPAPATHGAVPNIIGSALDYFTWRRRPRNKRLLPPSCVADRVSSASLIAVVRQRLLSGECSVRARLIGQVLGHFLIIKKLCQYFSILTPSLAVDAVQYEPVSRSKFPHNWENSGNFARFGPEICISRSDRKAQSKSCS